MADVKTLTVQTVTRVVISRQELLAWLVDRIANGGAVGKPRILVMTDGRLADMEGDELIVEWSREEKV